ncbi:hypothetical protein NIIDMKKI_74390 [Mycobacterium kansasii]|uniref:Uncharacterized protein n=1 Tax=Mycobacterium kansasii TaxID=1768 RepID=A0A7G1IR92_MYCKA|nr:hypothetical protein NIIDMKKI_74390 [Mycobacterium kansasii]
MPVHRDVLTVIGVGGIGEAIDRRLAPAKTVPRADNNDGDGGIRRSNPSPLQAIRCWVTVSTSVSGISSRARPVRCLLTNVKGGAYRRESRRKLRRMNPGCRPAGFALMLRQLGAVIAPGGAVGDRQHGGHLVPALTAVHEHALAHNPPGDLILDFVCRVAEPAFAYPIAKPIRSSACRERALGPPRMQGSTRSVPALSRRQWGNRNWIPPSATACGR